MAQPPSPVPSSDIPWWRRWLGALASLFGAGPQATASTAASAGPAADAAPGGASLDGAGAASQAPASGLPCPQACPPGASAAATARAYRKDAATHLYALNAQRIFKGPLPPLLYAIGVLEVEVDAAGNVGALHWLRAPSHAPEVVQEIERTVYEAAPFPAPLRLGRVAYTDTWLWDRSGHFQLDTLTEGQL